MALLTECAGILGERKNRGKDAGDEGVALHRGAHPRVPAHVIPCGLDLATRAAEIRQRFRIRPLAFGRNSGERWFSVFVENATHFRRNRLKSITLFGDWPMETDHPYRALDLFVTGVRNAHALERQALSVMSPQLDRSKDYPEVVDKLRRHIEETHGQIRRLDEIMAMLDERPSSIKDAALSFAGGMAGISHSFASDAILKDSFANYAFENYEIAAYESLIIVANASQMQRAVPLLDQTLTEERRMAEWIQRSLPILTRRYIEISAAKATSR